MSTPDYEDWVQKAENKFAIQQQKFVRNNPRIQAIQEQRYDYDYRNPTHKVLGWTACTYDTCGTPDLSTIRLA
jgi:hypothetical protein